MDSIPLTHLSHHEGAWMDRGAGGQRSARTKVAADSRRERETAECRSSVGPVVAARQLGQPFFGIRAAALCL